MKRSSNRHHRPAVAVGAATLAVLLAAATLVAASAALAESPGTWTRISDPTGVNIDEVGLARTANGTLHVAWLRKSGNQVDLMHTAIAKSGRTLGAPVAIVRGWDSIGNPTLLAPAGGLRVVFGGIRSTDAGETNNSMNTATARPDGSSWKLVTGPIVKATSAYASPAGATLERDGTPVTTWATSAGLGIHVGVDQTGNDRILQTACCAYQPQLATDGRTGRVVLAWYSNAKGGKGIFAQAVVPAGKKLLAPGSTSSSDADEQHAAIRARSGAPGVYLAYCGGGAVFCRNVLLWRYSGGAPLVVAKAPDATTHAGRRVTLAAGPEGRLWVTWERGGQIYAARTNKAATRVGPIFSTAPPRGTTTVWKLDGDGSNGPLDLLASVGTGAGIATWHTQLLPPLTLTGTAHKLGAKRRIVLTVGDAGDPVSGATIKSIGPTAGLPVPKSKKTDAHGRVVLTVPAPKGGARPVLSFTATEAGYAAARTTVTVR